VFNRPVSELGPASGRRWPRPLRGIAARLHRVTARRLDRPALTSTCSDLDHHGYR
jgi:hypothetical protein